MKKIYKRLLASVCALSILMTVPGMSLLADEYQEEIIVDAEEIESEELREPEILDNEDSAEEIDTIVDKRN